MKDARQAIEEGTMMELKEKDYMNAYTQISEECRVLKKENIHMKMLMKKYDDVIKTISKAIWRIQ